MYFTQHCIILQAGSQFDDQVRDSVFIECTLIMRYLLIRVCVVGQEAQGCDCCACRSHNEQRGHTQHQTISFSGVGEDRIFFQGEQLCRM